MCVLHRPYKVFRHKIGRPAAEDVVVYEEKDEVRCEDTKKTIKKKDTKKAH